MEERKSFFRQLGLPRHDVFEYAMRSFETPAFDLDYFEYRIHKMQGQRINEADIKRQLLGEVCDMLQAPSRNMRRSPSPVVPEAPPPPNIKGYLTKKNNSTVDFSRDRSPSLNISNGNRQFQNQSASSSRNFGNLESSLNKLSAAIQSNPNNDNFQTPPNPQQQRGGVQTSNWNQSQSLVPAQFNRGPTSNQSNFGKSNNSMMPQKFNDFMQQSRSNFDSSGQMSDFLRQPQNNMINQSDNFNNKNSMNAMNNMSNVNDGPWGGFGNNNQNQQFNHSQSNMPNRSSNKPLSNNSGSRFNNFDSRPDNFEPRSDNFGSRFDDSGSRFENFGQGFNNSGPQFENSRFGNVNTRFDNSGSRFDNSGQRFENSGSRFDNSGQRLDNLSSRFDNFGSNFDNSGSRFDNSEPRFPNSDSRFDNSGPCMDNFGANFNNSGSRFENSASRFDNFGPNFDNNGPQRFDNSGAQFNNSGPQNNNFGQFDNSASRFGNIRDERSRFETSRDRSTRQPQKPSANKNQMAPPPRALPNPRSRQTAPRLAPKQIQANVQAKVLPKNQPRAAQPKNQPSSQPRAQPQTKPRGQPRNQPKPQPQIQPRSQPRVQPQIQPRVPPKIQPIRKAPTAPIDPFVHQRSQSSKQKLQGSKKTLTATGSKRAYKENESSATANQQPATKRFKLDSSSEIPKPENIKESAKREDWELISDEFMRPEMFGDVITPRPKGYMTRDEFNKWWNENQWIPDKLMIVHDNDPAIKSFFFSPKNKDINAKKLIVCEGLIEKSINTLDDWRLHSCAFDFLKSKAIVNEFLFVEKRDYLGNSGQRCLNRIFTVLRKANMIAFFKAIIQEFSIIARKNISLGYRPPLQELLHNKVFNWLVDLAFKEIKLFAEPVRRLKSNKLKLKIKELHTFATNKNKELCKSGNPYAVVKEADKNEYVRKIMKDLEALLQEKREFNYKNCKSFMELKLRLANKGLIKHLNKEAIDERLAFLTKLKADEYAQRVELYMLRKLMNIYNRLKYLEAVHPRMIVREDYHQMLVFQKFISEENITLIVGHILDEWLEMYGNFSHPTVSINMQKSLKTRLHERGDDSVAANKNDDDDEYDEDNDDDDEQEDIDMQSKENVDENNEEVEENKNGDAEADVVEIIDDEKPVKVVPEDNVEAGQNNVLNIDEAKKADEQPKRATRGRANGAAGQK